MKARQFEYVGKNLTDYKLALIQQEKERQAKLKAIETDEAYGSTAWHFNIWNFFVSIAVAIQEKFKSIPFIDILFPDNPGKQQLLATLKFASWSFLLKFISPVALAFSWVHTGLAFKRLWESEKRTAWDYANAFLSFGLSLAWTILYAVGAAGAIAAVGSALASVPYFIPALLGVCALSGMVNCIRNGIKAVFAWKAGNKEECKAYAWNAVKSLFSAVTNTLSLVTSVFLGIKMSEAAELITKNFAAGKEAIKACFSKASELLYALTISTGINSILNTTKMNQETWNTLRHPNDALKRAYYAVKANPLVLLKEIILLPIKLPLRVAAFVVAGPIQLIGKAVFAGIGKLMQGASSKKNVTSEAVIASPEQKLTIVEQKPIIPPAAEVAIVPPEQKSVIEVAAPVGPKPTIAPCEKEAKLIEELKGKIQDMDASYQIEFSPPEKQAERFQLGQIYKLLTQSPVPTSSKNTKAKSYVSVAEIERDALKISHLSMFGRKEVSRLTEDAREVLANRNACAPAA